MRIVVNGWFLEQLTTGSGQYLSALAEWLRRVGQAHELFLVEPASVQGAKSKTQTDESNASHASRITHHVSEADWPSITVSTPFDRLSANLAKLWFEQITFPRACQRLRADVAFVPYWGAPWWRPCPIVVTVHDLIPLLLPAYRGGGLQRTYTWLVGRTARRATAVLTDSEASKRDIVTHLDIPPACVHAIHLAAGVSYRPVTDPAELNRVRAKYSLPDEPFLLYLGGFDVRKNVARMVEAYARMVVRSRESGVRSQPAPPLDLWRLTPDTCPLPGLVIAGKLPETDTSFAPDPRRLVDAFGVRDRVHFTGWVDEADKPALYSMAMGTVFVSEYEGFGLPVLEAMACEEVHLP